MVFVELTPFVAFRERYWTDEELRALQSFLPVSPDAGALIRGGSGLRDLRWLAQGAANGALPGSSAAGTSRRNAST